MDRITELEGVEMFFNNMEEIGVISPDNREFSAIHTSMSWKETKDKIDHLRLREMVDEIKFVKTTEMKNGLNNHIFTVDF